MMKALLGHQKTTKKNNRILLRLKERGIAETMVCRILMFIVYCTILY